MEIILIVAVIFILFGAKKIPEMMRGLGTGIKEFKKAANEVADTTTNNSNSNSNSNSNTTNNNKPEENK